MHGFKPRNKGLCSSKSMYKNVLSSFIHICPKLCLNQWMVKSIVREFPGGPLVRTPCFHCQGPGFNPWSGKLGPCKLRHGQKKKKYCGTSIQLNYYTYYTAKKKKKGNGPLIHTSVHLFYAFSLCMLWNIYWWPSPPSSQIDNWIRVSGSGVWAVPILKSSSGNFNVHVKCKRHWGGGRSMDFRTRESWVQFLPFTNCCVSETVFSCVKRAWACYLSHRAVVWIKWHVKVEVPEYRKCFINASFQPLHTFSLLWVLGRA